MKTPLPWTPCFELNPTEERRFKDGLTPEQIELDKVLTEKLRTLSEEDGLTLLHENCYVMVGWHNMTRSQVMGWYWTLRPRDPNPTSVPLSVADVEAGQ